MGVELAWETLEVNRIVREALAGSKTLTDRVREALSGDKPEEGREKRQPGTDLPDGWMKSDKIESDLPEGRSSMKVNLENCINMQTTSVRNIVSRPSEECINMQTASERNIVSRTSGECINMQTASVRNKVSRPSEECINMQTAQVGNISISCPVEDRDLENFEVMPRPDTAHTPPAGPRNQITCDNFTMTALHTPLVRPEHNRVLCTHQPAEYVSRARNEQLTGTGTKQCVQCTLTVQSVIQNTDSRKLDHHGSPRIASGVKLDKTPTMVGGKLEHFGSIIDMIKHWEGQEEEEEGRERMKREEGGGRRKSQRISELSSNFEGAEKDHTVRPGDGGEILGGEGPKRETNCSPLLKLRSQKVSTLCETDILNTQLSTNKKPGFSECDKELIVTNQMAGSTKRRKFASDVPGLRKRFKPDRGSTRTVYL